jgi:hypothetical protein
LSPLCFACGRERRNTQLLPGRRRVSSPERSGQRFTQHFPDDSPLFVAAWYTLAITFVSALGAVAGARLLRW